MHFRTCHTFFVFIFCWMSAFAQNSELSFSQVNYYEDFPQSMITSMVQTRKGFIWMGSENGLFRYDSYNFQRYIRDKNRDGSLSNNHVNVIFEDSQENIWIGTNHGLNLFNKNADNFTPINVSSVKGGVNYISSLAEDGEKNLWVGTFGGIKKYNPKTKQLENINNDANFPLNQSRVLSLFYDENFGMFVGTASGILYFNPKTAELQNLPSGFYANANFLTAKIRTITKDSQGNLWFGSESQGVFHYAKGNNTLTQYKHDFANQNSVSSNWINDIVEVGANTIWFATDDGLSIFNKQTKNFSRHNHSPINSSSISDNNLKCFLKDKNQCIWVGTNAGGINFYNKTNANFWSIGEVTNGKFGLNSAIVSAVIPENNGSVWVGTYGGGLTFLDLNQNKSISFVIDNDQKKTKNLITALANHGANSIICGTFNGLFRFDKFSKKFTSIALSNDGKIEDERPITSIISDGSELWIGTNGNGLKHILADGTVEHFRSDGTPNSLSDNFVMSLENRPNGVWIATQNGLNYFDKQKKAVTQIYKTNTQKRIANNSLTVMFTDVKGRLWIGADYDGLFCFDEKTQTFHTFNKANGFTDAAIKSITEDASGNLWVGSEDKLYQFSFNGKKSKKNPLAAKITRYSSRDGVYAKQFSNNSAIQVNENLVAFGTAKGLMFFNPKKIIKLGHDNQVVLTKLVVNNEKINPGEENEILSRNISDTKTITLQHNQRDIGLEFSNLNFINPKKSIYSYQLNSASEQDEWHNIGSQNRINLSNLNAGKYQLVIKSTNEDGSWNEAVQVLDIKILPPWWKSWWAYLLYFLIVLGSSLVIYRFVKNRIKLKRELLMEHMENDRKQEIFNMQLNFFTNISHEIRTPLTLIKGPVEELLSHSQNDVETEQKLKTIQQNSERLLKLVNELLDFRKAEKGHMKMYFEKHDIVAFCFEIFESFKGLATQKNIEYKFVLNTNSIFVYFDKNQMEKVIFNLLSNAFKFTKKHGKIVLAVEKGTDLENKIFIKVRDNGIGIPENSRDHIFNRFFQVDDRGVHNMGSGVGLALSKSIIELHKGEISILEEKDSWANTVFQIALQLGNQHLLEENIFDSTETEVPNVIKTEGELPELLSPESELIENFDDEIEIDLEKKTVMVVEDNEEVRKFVVNILKEDYQMIDFPNALDAIEFLLKEIPDIIISDVMMPEMDGLEFTTYLKTNETTNHIPVILLTAKASTDNKIEGLSTGADAYISKPFSTKILKLSVANLLSSKEILRQKYSGNSIIKSDIDKLTTPEESFLKKLMKVIEENLENPDFDVNMLVKEIGMSRTILYKKVNSLTDHSVASLIKHVRLKKAAEIIANTTFPISEVAFMVGFNDRKHFSREFKKVYKVSPTLYKND